MDLILIYPPYMIALACIYIAVVLKEKETTAWFEELRVDMNVVSLASKCLILPVCMVASLVQTILPMWGFAGQEHIHGNIGLL